MQLQSIDKFQTLIIPIEEEQEQNDKSGSTKKMKRVAQFPPNENLNKKREIEISWDQKKLKKNNFLITDQNEIIEKEHIPINGKPYFLKKIGSGEYHIAFEFTENLELEINNTIYKTQEIILKILNPQKTTQKNFKNIVLGNIKGYASLVENNVPVAKTYIDPVNYQEKSDPSNGMFWLIEKMHKKIHADAWKGNIKFDDLDLSSKEILNFAKKWLTKMAVTGKDLINDFRTRNTMLDSKGNPKIIDYSLPENEDWEITENLYRYTLDWANGNPLIYDYLSSDFPPSVKEKLDKK